MSTGDGPPLGAWVWPKEVELGTMVVVAQDGLQAPDLQLQLVRSSGDTLSVTTALASAASVGADDVVYVEGRGTFKVIRREGRTGGQVLLLLAAWPCRQQSA